MPKVLKVPKIPKVEERISLIKSTCIYVVHGKDIIKTRVFMISTEKI